MKNELAIRECEEHDFCFYMITQVMAPSTVGGLMFTERALVVCSRCAETRHVRIKDE